MVALIVLAALGALSFLRQRREGTILAVTIPVRAMGGRTNRTQSRRASSAHR
jgi:hypothetical protein